MYQRTLSFAVVLLLAFQAAPALPGQEKEGDQPISLAQAVNAFGFALQAQLEADGNLFFSPASIASALHLAYAGAEGETAREMAAVLGLRDLGPKDPEFDRLVSALIADLDRRHAGPESPRPGDAEAKPDAAVLHVVNRLFGLEGHPFRADYLARLEKKFRSSLHALDFVGDAEGSRRSINERIAQDTEGKIPDLLIEGDITPTVLLVLTNAIYFRNSWRDAFREALTKDENFEARPGDDFTVPMMNRRGRFSCAETDDLSILSLPYAAGDQSMILVLPKARHGLSAVEKKLDAETLTRLLDSLEKKDVSLKLPRFKIEQRYDLVAALRSLGMRRAFSPEAADFSGIDDGAGKLYFSKAIHKTFIEVDENGTEAAAATALIAKRGSAAPRGEPQSFVCDQPFLFFVHDQKTGMILFQGRCSDPRG